MASKRTAFVGVLGTALITLTVLATGNVPAPTFGDPLPGLSNDRVARLAAGQEAFEEKEDAADGLGPVFNDVSCASCHSVGATGGGSETLETRFGRIVNGVFDPLSQFGGSLIQTTGIGQF